VQALLLGSDATPRRSEVVRAVASGFLCVAIIILLFYNITDAYTSESSSVYNGFSNDIHVSDIKCESNGDCSSSGATCGGWADSFKGSVTVTANSDSICVNGRPSSATSEDTKLNLEVCMDSNNDDITSDKCGALCTFYRLTDLFDIAMATYLVWAFLMLIIKRALGKQNNKLTIVDMIFQIVLFAISVWYCVAWGEAHEESADEKERFDGYDKDNNCHNDGLQFVWKAHNVAHKDDDAFLDDDRQKAVLGFSIIILASSLAAFVAGIVLVIPANQDSVSKTGKGDAARNDNNESTDSDFNMQIGSLLF